jgi:hypothetical protein
MGQPCLSLVFVECCVGSSLCNDLITRLEEPYQVSVSTCVWRRNLNIKAAKARIGLLRHRKEQSITREYLISGVCAFLGEWQMPYLDFLCSGLLHGIRWFETDVSKLSVQFSRVKLMDRSSSTACFLKMGPIGSPETSVSNHPTPRNNPEGGISQFNRGGSLLSRRCRICL